MAVAWVHQNLMSSVSGLSASSTQLADPTRFEQKLFAQADTDGDGAISQNELQAMLEKHPRLARHLSALTDSSSTDASSTAAAVFSKLDTDGDGKVSAAEFQTGLKDARAAGRTQASGDLPPPPPASGGDFADMLQQIFSDGDSDGDGSLTADDLDAMMRQTPGLARDLSTLVGSSDGSTPDAAAILGQLDRDGDGKISQDEFIAGVATAHENVMAQSSANSSASTTGTTTSAEAMQSFLLELLQRLQQQNTAYTSDGSLGSTTTSTASTFEATV